MTDLRKGSLHLASGAERDTNKMHTHTHTRTKMFANVVGKTGPPNTFDNTTLKQYHTSYVKTLTVQTRLIVYVLISVPLCTVTKT